MQKVAQVRLCENSWRLLVILMYHGNILERRERISYLAGVVRNQGILFPEIVDDYIKDDNPVKFIEALWIVWI